MYIERSSLSTAPVSILHLVLSLYLSAFALEIMYFSLLTQLLHEYVEVLLQS
jgi:hypothetical protein